MLHVYPSAWESVLYRPIQCCAISNLNDGLDCRSCVSAVVCKNGGFAFRVESDVRPTRSRLESDRRSAKTVPLREASTALVRARGRPSPTACSRTWGGAYQSRPTPRPCGEYALMVRDDPRALMRDEGPAPAPYTFSLYFRIQLKRGRLRRRRYLRRRESEINTVANGFGHKSQPQRHYLRPGATLNGNLTGFHATRNLLWARPQGRCKTALFGQRRHYSALGGLRQETQCAIQIRLSAAVRSRDKR